MPTIRIVTDTTAGLPPDYAAAHAVAVVPQVVLFGGESFLEEVNLPYADFIRRLKASPRLPTTSAPPPGEFVKAYTRQLGQARTVISLHPSREVSGTVASAQTAKDNAFPDADIRVLDTRTVGGNLATMTRLAVQWAERGMTADQIMSWLQAMIPRGRTYFVVASLENLQKGGRIGGASALIGGVLQIKPILELRSGRVEVLEKVRTHQRALERLTELVIAQCPRSPEAHLCVMHADARDAAQRLASRLKAATGFGQVPLSGVSAAVTTHAGPGTLGVGFFV